MKRLLIGGLAALTIGLAAAPVAGAEPDCCEHEFDWATPYYEAFERHGIAYLSVEMGIPLLNEADQFCNGKASRESIRSVAQHWGGRKLTHVEAGKVIEAAADVCPEMA
jgi:hypothetical protein